MKTANSILLEEIEYDMSETENLENTIQWFWYLFGLNIFSKYIDDECGDINNIFY